MSLLGSIGSQLMSAAIQRFATPRNMTATAAAMVPGMALPSTVLRSLPMPGAMPGAGFRTGGGFPALARANGFRKRRRTNPTNVKALRRALSRVEGFIKIEKRVDKILRRVAPRARAAQRVGFVKRRR